jgi:lysozyme family protein
MTNFDCAFDYLMAFEGGYSNDPDDPGGETKYGISKRQYPDLDIKNLTIHQAKEIYWRDYWTKYKCNLFISPAVAAKVFIAVVNMNASRAIRYLQEACNTLGAGLVVDGRIGPATILWINSYRHAQAIVAAFEGELYQHYKNQNKPRFIAGWLMRSTTDFKA